MTEQQFAATAAAAGFSDEQIANLDPGRDSEMVRTLAALTANPLDGLGEIEWMDEWAIGTQDSCVIRPRSILMRVRGGGIGADAWVARVTGEHPKFGIEREFVDAQRALSGSGRSGSVSWTLTDDGVYEYRGLCVSSNYAKSGFFIVRDGKVASLGNRKVAVQKWAARTGGRVV